jgi:Family of unknown function (DUF6281)
VRVVLVLALATLVGGGCGGGNHRGVSSGAACAPLIEFQGREYLGENARDAAPQLAGPAGTAVVPGCNDVQPATTTESSTSVEAYELEGIPVERALGVQDQADIVYVARGICDGETAPASLVACLRPG